ncbi:alpha/beta hydrolase [Massilia sp. IC2-477]|uniref:alpha/beta fold hydrolase n=1 Tax=Massilia sp. IC2-477 TaxID=2887198 RepID=UPI001D11C306|nr:alpha/beta hydrolase [Massilia sp. IC2-477]MCC2957565.1 alpha/beta hydrolase [Massilia sp. IC2-477]
MAIYQADQAASCFVTVGGDSIAYRKIGAGSPLLLTNRLRGTLDTWDPLFLEGLAQEHTVITFDYPGVGYSGGVLPTDLDALGRLVIGLADALGLDRFAIGGWSWGGIVAQVVVTDHPERLTQAVIMGANPPGKNEIPIQQAFLDRALKPVNDLADEEVLFFVPDSPRSVAAARASHERIHARPGVVDRIPSTMPEFMRYFKAVEGFRSDEEDRRGALAGTSVPILLLCGDHDISAAAGNWYPMIGAFPRAQLLVLGDAGHAPQHEYPELAARYINTFLDAGTS